jgi:hypothetical protein
VALQDSPRCTERSNIIGDAAARQRRRLHIPGPQVPLTRPARA